jgi:integrase
MKSLVLDSVSSPITKRVYNMALDEFFGWYAQERAARLHQRHRERLARNPGRTRAGFVFDHRPHVGHHKLAVEAMDNGLLAPDLAAGIQRVKSAKSIGVRAGNWLSLKQAQALLNAPDITTTKGLRDRAIIAVLLGYALRRSEVAALTMNHIQQRDGRWCIVDLYGKHGRVRTIPMPTWVKVAIDAWIAPPGVLDGCVFRPVIRGDQVRGDVLSEKVIWQMLRPHAKAAGVPGIAPHDCRRYADSRTMPNGWIVGTPARFSIGNIAA